MRENKILSAQARYSMSQYLNLNKSSEISLLIGIESEQNDGQSYRCATNIQLNLAEYSL